MIMYITNKSYVINLLFESSYLEESASLGNMSFVSR